MAKVPIIVISKTVKRVEYEGDWNISIRRFIELCRIYEDDTRGQINCSQIVIDIYSRFEYDDSDLITSY